MFQFIRSSSFTAQVMVPVIGILLFAAAWFLPGVLASGETYGNGFFFLPEDGWLYDQWVAMERLPLWIQIASSALVAVITALSLIRIDLRSMLMGRRSFGIGYVYLFLVASQGHLILFHPASVSAMLMLVGTGYLAALFKQESRYELVLGLAFSWGVALLIYPPVLVTVPVVFVGIGIMVTPTWRHWMAALLGVSLPALISSAVFFLIGDLDYQIFSFFSWFKLRSFGLPEFLKGEILILAWFLMIVIWSVIATVRYRNPKVLSRQLFLVNFIQFTSLVLMTLLLRTVGVEAFWPMLLPVTFFLTFWLLELKRNWVRDLFFVTLLLTFAFFRIRGLI